jgi:hypothetical protein
MIFKVKSEDTGKIKKLVDDDLVSRQSVLTRDSSSLDIKGESSYVKIEGSKEGLKRAEELGKELGFKKLSGKEAEKVNDMIEEQENSAASGMGTIFG